ncbi:MAG: histidinol dehydrogenase, partial [Luteimonas sp.]|nr:histidinol dehydrogenase [Luteimonas sp.]
MKRLVWSELDEAVRADMLERPTQSVSESVRAAVAQILEQVDQRGDAALRELTQSFDALELETFAVGADEFADAERTVSADLREAMVDAATRIEAFHRAGMTPSYAIETAPGVTCERIVRPIRRVGLYVPAGSAPLPSTALMLGVPARLAGCAQV